MTSGRRTRPHSGGRRRRRLLPLSRKPTSRAGAALGRIAVRVQIAQRRISFRLPPPPVLPVFAQRTGGEIQPPMRERGQKAASCSTVATQPGANNQYYEVTLTGDFSPCSGLKAGQAGPKLAIGRRRPARMQPMSEPAPPPARPKSKALWIQINRSPGSEEGVSREHPAAPRLPALVLRAGRQPPGA